MQGLEKVLLVNFRLAVLEACHWNRTVAAEHLGISSRCLRKYIAKLKGMGFDVPGNANARGFVNLDRVIAWVNYDNQIKKRLGVAR
jgi:hypothetical protein